MGARWESLLRGSSRIHDGSDMGAQNDRDVRGTLRRSRHFFRREEGAALAELALVIPLVLVLLLGMIDFGKALNYWIDQTHLANEGARFAVVNKNPGSGAGQTLQQYILSQGDTPELRGQAAGTQESQHAAQVFICFPNGSSAVGDPVRVIVSYEYQWLRFLRSNLPVVGTILGGGASTTVSGSSTMRLEAAPTNYSSNGPCP